MAKRRSRGDGSVTYRAESDLWQGSISLGVKPDGSRDRRTVYAKSKSECIVAIQRLRGEAKQSTVASGPNKTVREYLKFWLGAIETAGAKPSTMESYTRYVDKYLIPLLGSAFIQQLTAYHAHTLFTSMAEVNQTNYTQRYAFRVLRTALTYAVDPLRLLPNNPLFGVKSPKHTVRKMTTWTPEQCGAFLTATRDHKYYVAFVMGIDTGMREGEILGLQWGDIDFTQRVVNVDKTLHIRDGKILGRGALKTLSSKRTVPLTQRSVEALALQRMRTGATSPWVVPNVEGGPVNRSNFLKDFRKAIRSVADLPMIRFHDTRHTHATVLIQAGVDPKTVAERLGHSSVTTTMQTYMHSDLKHQRAVTERLTKIMDGKND